MNDNYSQEKKCHQRQAPSLTIKLFKWKIKIHTVDNKVEVDWELFKKVLQ